MKFAKPASLVLAAILFAVTLMVAAQPMVGGAAMYPTKDIVDNAVNSKDQTPHVAAVKAASLVEPLKSPGPFTVFAPTNRAFGALPAGTVDTLLKPENKAKLTSLLTYHMVAGKIDFAAMMAALKTGGGKVMVMDESGGTATVTIADVYQSNGVIHVVDKVLLPK